MGAGSVEWLAVVGGIIAAACAAACAVACAILARETRRASTGAHRPLPYGHPPAPQPLPQIVFAQQPAPQPTYVIAPPPAPAPQPVTYVVQAPPAYAPTPIAPPPGHVPMSAPTHAASHAPAGWDPGGTRGPLVLEGHYPQLGRALGSWLQVEQDPVERTRIARDLGGVGGADAARALLDGVRTGVITPTIAADNLERGGFEAGIAVAAALRDTEPRVRALASTLVGRCTPLESAELRPMPVPPRGPTRGQG